MNFFSAIRTLAYATFAAAGLTSAVCRAQTCDAVPDLISSNPATFQSTKNTYSVSGLKGFTTDPRSSGGVAYRQATFGGEIYSIKRVDSAPYNAETGTVLGPMETTVAKTVSGARGEKKVRPDGTIEDSSALYGATYTGPDLSSLTVASQYEYSAVANPSGYRSEFLSYSAISDTRAAKSNPEVPFHKTKEVYANVYRFTTLLFDVNGNITSARTQWYLGDIDGGSGGFDSQGQPWGPLIRVEYEGSGGTSSIDLSDPFVVADALANPPNLTPQVTQGIENSAYIQPPNAQNVQYNLFAPRPTVYTWSWSTQTAKFQASFPIKCPGKYRVLLTYGKQPLGGGLGVYGSFTLSEEVTFDDPTNAVIERDIPVVDPSVGTTEVNERYYFTTAQAEKICEQRSAGDAVDSLGSVHSAFYLGRRSGWIRLKRGGIGSSSYSPEALTWPTRTPGSDFVLNAGRSRWQYKALDALVEIKVIDANGYTMDFYHAPQVGAKDPVTRFYALAGSPFVSYLVSNPDPTSPDVRKLRITRTPGGSVVEYSFLNLWTNTTGKEIWSLTKGGSTERRTETWTNNYYNHDVLIETLGSNGNRVSATLKRYYKFYIPSGTEQLIQEIVDPDGLARTTTYDYEYNPSLNYYTAVANNPGYGLLRQLTRPDGSWERYVYDSSRRVTKTLRPFLNATPTSDESQCRVSQVVRSTLPDADGDGQPEAMETDIESIQGHEVARTYQLKWSKSAALGSGNFRKLNGIRCTSPGAAWNDATNLVTTTYKYTGAPFDGETRLVVNPDGTATATILSVDSQGGKTIEVKTGPPNASLTDLLSGRRAVSLVNASGWTIAESNYDIASGLALDSWSATQVDASDRPTRLDYTDGTFVLRSYACCGLDSETDREGIATSYVYENGRLVRSTRAGIATRYEYDAAGRQTGVFRIGSAGVEIPVEADVYDPAGRLVSRTVAGLRTTIFAEIRDAGGQTVKTTTAPDGGSRAETYALDGSLVTVSGSAAAPLKYEYGVEANGSFTKEIRVGPAGAETEWTKAYTDFAGRTAREERPASSGSTFTLTFTYNSLGQLEKQVDPDGVATLYAYDARGRQSVTALDIDRDGVIDYDGADRVSRAHREVTSAHGATVERTTTTVWTAAGAQDVAVVDSTPNGRQTWQNVSGLTTQTSVAYDGAGGRTETTTVPDGTVTTLVYQTDRLVSNTVSHPSLGALSSSIYAYDPHGRLQSATDARNGTTTFTYYDDDQLHAVTTPDPDPARSGPGYDPQTTAYVYDAAGRLSQTTLPDGGVVTNEYYPTGLPKKTSGARTYPQEYTYDEQGRVKTLKTWQNFAGNTGTAVTTWNYDSTRGWLNSKQYAGGAGPSYTYWPSGRLRTRTWARGGVTTYNYNQAGDLAGMSYSDSTPSVAFTYDSLGRLASKTDGAGACTYTYQGATSLLTAESHTAGLLNGLSVNRSYDSLLRLSSLSPFPSLPSVNYSYDSASRLQTVTSGTNTATYSYVANSPLVGGLVFKQNSATRLTTTKTYDNLNRLAGITHSSPFPSLSSVQYQYNSANQRTRATREDLPAGAGSAYWDYAYDALGQVTVGKKFQADNTALLGHDYAWTYDDIGNRRTATTNGQLSTLTPNTLNQYAQRTVPGGFDVLGAVEADATATVAQPANGAAQPMQRQGELFYRQLTVDNLTAPQFAEIKVTAMRGSDTVQETRHAFVAQTPELYSYDADGNPTRDGRWNYTWDGENRLIAIETNASAATAGVPKKKLEFAYDGQSRRISKKVYDWTGSAWTLSASLRFIYDNWNLLAEVNDADTAVRTYAWGLDLSGGLQGAGGVGGLLLATLGGATHSLSYDGNGNVIWLVSLSDGTLAGRYDYNAFGETVLSEGTLAAGNPFRFSTKYQDVDTGLLYYGFRYYQSATGRWLSRDPAEEAAGGPNLYAMVSNDAVNKNDPLGLWEGPVHHQIVDDWLRDGKYGKYPWKCCCEIDVRALLKSGSDEVDGGGDPVSFLGAQSSWNSHEHAMRQHGESVASAQAKYRQFLNGAISRAQQMAAQARNASCGSTSRNGGPALSCTQIQQAIRTLGHAYHAYSDSLSPAHAGFQEWLGLSWFIFTGPLYIDYVQQHHERETMAVYNRMKGPVVESVRGQFQGILDALLQHD